MDERELSARTFSTPAAQRTTTDPSRLRRAAWAYTTRRVPRQQQFQISRPALAPRPGDLLLARIDVLGSHRSLQLRNGRKRTLFPGDEVVIAYGNRYASSQFEALVPQTLGPCHLVAGGGVAAKVVSWHMRLSQGPTSITPVGFLLRADCQRVNLADYAIEPVGEVTMPCPATIAVVGTTMDAGKTSAAAYLVRGIRRAGLHVGYAKVTGTGASGDTWLLKDAGAAPALDFTDAGHVSTYRVPPPELERIFVTLIEHLVRAQVDVIVIEVADGVLQTETAALLESSKVKAVVGSVFFAASDAAGALAGVTWLAQRGLPIAGIGGLLTASPLQRAEATTATGVATFRLDELAQAHVASAVLAKARKLRIISGGSDAGSDGIGDNEGSAAQA
jgi:hypothetical protein